ncbi:unnamed protein product [Rotaria sordida]|uniref:NHL repeat containing protein n=1 Tax=Rotaria sordida TaxID=392033 RepID=A0A818VR19_9BILA|nr:unnamed protein product [Rotaria sordida]
MTQPFVSNTEIGTGQNTAVTNFDQIARQIEAAYGLPTGSIRITNIVINGVTTNAGSGRRRRRALYRKKRQLISNTTVTAAAAAAASAGASVCSLQWIATGTTVAGVTNTAGNDAASLNTPRDVVLDTANTFIVADTTNNRIQRWTIGNTPGVTVAGQAGGGGGTGATLLSGPQGVAFDSNDNIYVADTANSRVQFWLFGAAQGTTITGPSKLA